VRAAWYEHQGSPRESLVVGEMPDPVPGDGEVRIALTVSGMSPGDMKKRAGWPGSPMTFPRVIPHSDGAGTIDAAGPGIPRERIGEHVWCYGAQSYRPFGTAAEYVTVPGHLAVALPQDAAGTAATERDTLDEQASCLGIAGITAYRAVFADGPPAGLVVLIHGATGGVGSIATQLARRAGATVLAVVRDAGQLGRARHLGAGEAFLDSDPALAERIREAAPEGANRIVDVDFAVHADLNAEVLAVGGVVSSYASSADRPAIPYWAFGFKDTTLRLLGSDDFSPAVKSAAAQALTGALTGGDLRSEIAARFPLDQIASAHELVERGGPGRVLLTIHS
jgi:NADPH2:quinone reductase